MKMKFLSSFLTLLLASSIGLTDATIANSKSKKQPDKRIHKGEIPAQIADLREQIKNLEEQIGQIELTPGPQGPQGEQGVQGVSGSDGVDGVDGVDGDIVAAGQGCDDGYQVIGFDDDGNIICNGEARDYKYVFVSSHTYTGNLGGTDGVDVECTDLAHAAGLKGNYVAWLSDSYSSPYRRKAEFAGPYILLNGALVANSWEDLTDGILSTRIDLDENANRVSGALVWTGTTICGTAQWHNCSDWKDAGDSLLGAVGKSDYRYEDWTYYGNGDCEDSYHLYCFKRTSKQ